MKKHKGSYDTITATDTGSVRTEAPQEDGVHQFADGREVTTPPIQATDSVQVLEEDINVPVMSTKWHVGKLLLKLREKHRITDIAWEELIQEFEQIIQPQLVNTRHIKFR